MEADTTTVQDAIPAAPPKMRWWGYLGIGFAVFVILVGLAGFVIHVPYSTISPGEAVSLTSLVKVDGGQTYDTPRGDIRLLFVRERNHVNLWRYLQAQLDSNTDVFKEKELNPSNLSQDDLNADANNDMATAKLSATKVALEAAGYKVGTAKGILVTGVVPSGPSGKVLKPGDVIVSADGKPVNDNDALHNVHRSATRLVTRSRSASLATGKPLTVVTHVGQFKTDDPKHPVTGIGVEHLPELPLPGEGFRRHGRDRRAVGWPRHDACDPRRHHARRLDRRYARRSDGHDRSERQRR